MNILDFLNI